MAVNGVACRRRRLSSGLTGRENVYLGSGLFGLTRKELDRRFDAIVDFADVARLIFTPMSATRPDMRLGFAVAIYSRPDRAGG